MDAVAHANAGMIEEMRFDEHGIDFKFQVAQFFDADVAGHLLHRDREVWTFHLAG